MPATWARERPALVLIRLPAATSTPSCTHIGCRLPALDPTLPSTYALAVLATLWACVLPDVRSRAAWLAGGGMDCLLRCLAAGNKHHRPAIIGLLADALADTRSHAFVHAWRGGGGSAGAGVPAARLLLDVWREQAGRRGICGPDGLLAAPARPLAGGGDQAACGTLEAAGGADAASRALLGGLQPVRRQQVAAIMQGCSSDQLLDKVRAASRSRRQAAQVLGDGISTWPWASPPA